MPVTARSSTSSKYRSKKGFIMSNVKHDKGIVVFGLFDTRVELEAAIDGLRTEGFRESDISALLPDARSTNYVTHATHTKTHTRALVGAATGGVVGGTLGLL